MLKDRWPGVNPYYLATFGDTLPSGTGIEAEFGRTWAEQPAAGMLRQKALEEQDPSLQSPYVEEEKKRLAEQDAAYREGLATETQLRTGVYQPRTLPPIVAPSEIRNPEGPPPPTPVLTPEEATAKYGIPGVLTFKEPVREGVAQIHHDNTLKQLRLDDILARSNTGLFSGLGRVAAWALAQAVDPFNIASAFIPVVGEARYAAWLKNYGKYGARILKGAAEGGVGQGVLEPFTYMNYKEAGEDYGPLTALLDVTFGTVLGGGLHVGMGALGDAFGKLKFKDREALIRGAVAQLAENGEVRMDAVTPPVMRAAAEEARKTVEITRAEEAAIQRYRETGDISELRDVRIERARDILEGEAEPVLERIEPTPEEAIAIEKYRETGDIGELRETRLLVAQQELERAAEVQAQAKPEGVAAEAPVVGAGRAPEQQAPAGDAAHAAAMADRTAARTLIRLREAGFSDEKILAEATALQTDHRLRAVMALSDEDLKTAANTPRTRGRVGETAAPARAAEAADAARVTPEDLATAARDAVAPGNEEGRAFSEGADAVVKDASDTPDLRQLDSDIEDTTISLEKAKEVGAVEEGDLEKALEQIADLDRAAAEDAAVFDAAAACIARNGGGGGEPLRTKAVRRDATGRPLERERLNLGLTEKELTRQAKKMAVMDDDLRAAAMADTQNASRVITLDMEADAGGVVVGQEGRLDWILNSGKQYSEADIAKAWSGTRDLIRKKYGDEVVLYRADAPANERSPNTRTLRFGDKEMADQFAVNGREAKPYVVPTDDILAVFTSPGGTYSEFIVRKPKERRVK